MYGRTGNSKLGPLHLSYPGQLISIVLLGKTTCTIFLPIQSFCPLRNSQQTHVNPVRTYWFNKFNKCLHSNGTKCNRKKGHIKINNFLHRRRKMCMEINFKNNIDPTQRLFLIYSHVLVLDWGKRSFIFNFISFY